MTCSGNLPPNPSFLVSVGAAVRALTPNGKSETPPLLAHRHLVVSLLQDTSDIVTEELRKISMAQSEFGPTNWEQIRLSLSTIIIATDLLKNTAEILHRDTMNVLEEKKKHES